MNDLKKQIEVLAGRDGWWKAGTSETLLNCANEMVAAGINGSVAIAWIKAIAGAMQEEYGD